MQESGLIEICSHSTNHLDYSKIDVNEFEADIIGSFEGIDKNMGSKAKRVFCYPYGKYKDEEIEKLKSYNIIQNLTDSKVNDSKNLDIYRLHRQYPMESSALEMVIKTEYRSIRYGGK
ncbi:MAG: polysaccharide deacetylase family protein [Clostridia bacterium]|nr:polysaccharide deacetylase family protein [Clostridia bacterium]